MNQVTLIDIATIIALFLFMAFVIVAFIIFYHKMAPAADRIVSSQVEVSLRQTIQYEKAIDKILMRIKLELNAFDVYVARFHNGGSFNNGTRMKKFSIPYGKASSTIRELVRWKFYDKFCSHWPDVIDQMLVMNEYCCSDIKDCNDLTFKKDMEYYDFKSCHLFLICQDDLSRSPEGFIAINFKESKVLTKEERDIVKNEIPRLLSLMNLTPFNKEELIKLR
jgi:hypothetical protein